MRPKKQTAQPPIVRFFLYSLFLLVIPIILILWIAKSPLPPGRFTVATLGEPIEVLSYDQERNYWTIIQMTKDAHVSGVFGLGEYRLDALFELGKIEATPSAYLLDSLSEEFGVTIPYVLAKKDDPFVPWENHLSHTKQFITLANWLPFLRGAFRSNIPPDLYIKLWWKLRTMEPERVDRYILREDSGLVRQRAQDDNTFLRFDRQAFDVRTNDAFEELVVRQEAKRIIVYNTTDKPAIGARVGRMISKLGANVVQVGNDLNAPGEDCTISGIESELSSVTSKRIQELFDCVPVESEEQGQGDLVIRVGQAYAERFTPVDH